MKWRRTFGMVGLSALIGFCVLGLVHSIRNSDRFALKTIEIEGSERVSAEGVRRLSGLQTGRNLFKLDLVGAEIQIEAHPMVREARVRRELPDGVRISLTEWEPAFLVALGRTYVADPSGRIIKALEPRDAMDLVLVTGVDRSEVQESRLPRLAKATELLSAWDAVELPPASELHLPPDGPATLRTRAGWEAVLAEGSELQTVAEAVGKAERKGPIQRVRVDGGRRQGRITVAWEVDDG
ncbi:MAG: FtsQ-type POTRA domain-containing protein [Myxococcota bacterium]